jgi:predicted membrane protein
MIIKDTFVDFAAINFAAVKVTDIFGLFGVIIVLGTYLLMQMDKLPTSGLLFSLFNFIGSVFLLISLMGDWNLSSVVVEIIWQLISVYGMISYFRNKKKEQARPVNPGRDLASA